MVRPPENSAPGLFRSPSGPCFPLEDRTLPSPCRFASRGKGAAAALPLLPDAAAPPPPRPGAVALPVRLDAAAPPLPSRRSRSPRTPRSSAAPPPRPPPPHPPRQHLPPRRRSCNSTPNS
ncbi:unnamed protein product [Urochloa humidicola]